MLIAGEPSGDLLAAEFVKALNKSGRQSALGAPAPAIFGAGGPRMAELG